MSTIQPLIDLLKKQIDDRARFVELSRKQHSAASHAKNCFCGQMIDQEAADIAGDRAALAAIEATI